MDSTALTIIHKYIRREMFDFSQRIFRAGWRDAQALRGAFTELETLLRSHAAKDEARFQPALKKLDPAAVAQLSAEHEQLETQLSEIARLIAALGSDERDIAALSQLHLDWNRFVARYLLHLDHEERSMFAAISEQLAIESLVRNAIAEGAEGRRFLDRLWSVTTPAERCAIERAMMTGAGQSGAFAMSA